MSKKMLVIYGCHGAGKTTLAKNILTSEGETSEITTEFGKITLSKNKTYIAVGKYTTKCGGADSVKSVQDYFNEIYYIAQHYPKSKILVEGIFLSALWETPLKHYLKIKYDMGYDIEQVLLFAEAKTSYERVFARNNRQPKVDNIVNKQKSVLRTFRRFAKLGEFRNFIINTEGKTAVEVFEEFLNKSQYVKE